MNEEEVNPLAVVGVLVAAVVVIWLIAFGIDSLSSRATPQAGEVGVARQGTSFWWAPSWWNGHAIRTTLPPNSGSKFVGLGSKVHYYPSNASQRTYTITADRSRGDRPGVDVEYVSTADGVQVGLEGTFYFKTAFDGSARGTELLEQFDNRFGVRTFPESGSSRDLHAWQGSDGWEAFLDNQIRPIIDNDLRSSIQEVNCEQLVASCALVYNSTNVSAVRNAGSKNVQTLQKIQRTINSNLQQDIASTLGADYFSNVQFLVTGKPSLPTTVQGEINKAQAQFAAVGTSQAKVQQARLDAKANKIRQQGYKGCSACAEQDIIKSIPSNVTTFAPGAGFAVTGR